MTTVTTAPGKEQDDGGGDAKTVDGGGSKKCYIVWTPFKVRVASRNR